MFEHSVIDAFNSAIVPNLSMLGSEVTNGDEDLIFESLLINPEVNKTKLYHAYLSSKLANHIESDDVVGFIKVYCTDSEGEVDWLGIDVRGTSIFINGSEEVSLKDILELVIDFETQN